MLHIPATAGLLQIGRRHLHQSPHPIEFSPGQQPCIRGYPGSVELIYWGVFVMISSGLGTREVKALIDHFQRGKILYKISEVVEMKVERIDFVTFFVKDLDKAVKFFGELFETQFIAPYSTSVDTKETIDSLGVNLTAPLTQDGLSARIMATRGEGLATIVFKVANLDEAIAELESRGVRLLGREKIGSAEYAVFHPKDTFGAMLSVVEYKEKDAATAFTSR